MQKSVHTSEYDRVRSHLRSARQAAGLSQRDLAQRLDVPHSWVAKVEMGERRIDLVEFCRFVAACGGEPAEEMSRLVASFRLRKAKASRTKESGR